MPHWGPDRHSEPLEQNVINLQILTELGHRQAGGMGGGGGVRVRLVLWYILEMCLLSSRCRCHLFIYKNYVKRNILGYSIFGRPLLILLSDLISQVVCIDSVVLFSF